MAEQQMQFICVTCPVGCTIDATIDGERLVDVHGSACKRGRAFVEEELAAPKRMLTTTVRVNGGAMPLVPVRSVGPLPKKLLLAVAAQLRGVVLDAPVAEHQVVIADVLKTGVDVIASREVPRA